MGLGSLLPMTTRWILALAFGLLALTSPTTSRAATQGPLRLHPANPHYFEFRGKPTILVTSGEHYGAVLNLDFNYVRYLDTLHAQGMNLTRTFSGAYLEPAGAFNITKNTLAPEPGRFIAPWAAVRDRRSASQTPKYDLHKWNKDYFQRLRDFVRQAGRRDIVVEFTLFCPFYEDSQWLLSPMNSQNNVQGLGSIPRTNVYTLDRHEGLLEVQERLVRKVVSELRHFDNVIYEICNEPYFGGVTVAWQHHMAELIKQTEGSFKVPHLISRNVANGASRIEDPHPAISIYNFHYASPPNAVGMNRHLPCAMGDNETGFRGTNDLPYRVEAWNFLLAGGALFNHLDYSFTADHENGTYAHYPATQPGGGNRHLRRQFRILRLFMEDMNFLAMKPDASAVTLTAGDGLRVQALIEPGRTYAAYVSPDDIVRGKVDRLKQPPATGLERRAAVSVELNPGNYQAEWLSPETGGILQVKALRRYPGGRQEFQSPSFAEDIALRVRAAVP